MPSESNTLSGIKLTLMVYVGVLVLVGLFTWPAVFNSRYSIGNYLLMAGIAVAILGFLGMGISGTGRYSDIGPLLRDRKSHESLMKKGASGLKVYLSVILGGVLAAATGYLLVLISRQG
jgi:hypothetical protein